MTVPTPDVPRCFISYSHDSEQLRAHVAAIASALRAHRIDAQIDQYVETTPPLSWPQWMVSEIESADHVLVVCTEKYYRRFKGIEEPGIGLGARWEGAVITGELYEAEGTKVKFIPIIVSKDDAQFVPNPLRLTTRHLIESVDHKEIEQLVRQIRGIPLVVPPPLGNNTPESSTPPSVNKPDDPIDVAILLAAENYKEGVRQLEGMIAGGDIHRSARAAYEVGRIKHSHQQYAEAIAAFQRAIDYGPATKVFNDAVVELQQVLLEMNVHLGPGSAVEAVNQWLSAVKDGDVGKAWRGIERPLRTAIAQNWILANEKHKSLRGIDRDDLAKNLSAAHPTQSQLSSAFFHTTISELQSAFHGYDEDTWGAGEKPRRFGIDYELIILMDTGGDVLIWKDEEPVKSYPFLMRRIHNTWYISSFNPSYVHPGWPPTYTPLPIEGIRFGPMD